ncbi:MAG: DUF1934 domain-containing protein [Clostridiales bacterium]|nr:DUF1934 domain-containing protein [Clostridiales bacterium]
MLKIIGKQLSYDMEEVQMEFITEGQIYEKDETMFLVYDESEFSGMPGCKTKMEFSGDQIRMSRLGIGVGSDTEIQFQKGKRYTGYYDTPFGAIEMEVLTNDIENNLSMEGKGSVNIDYHISLKGFSEGRNRLNIEVM